MKCRLTRLWRINAWQPSGLSGGGLYPVVQTDHPGFNQRYYWPASKRRSISWFALESRSENWLSNPHRNHLQARAHARKNVPFMLMWAGGKCCKNIGLIQYHCAKCVLQYCAGDMCWGFLVCLFCLRKTIPPIVQITSSSRLCLTSRTTEEF